MATPQSLVSSLSSTRYHPARFWLVRFGSFVLVAILLYAVQRFLDPHLDIYARRILFNGIQFATLAVSLNLINGITGQFSMGHAAFYLAGAIFAGKLSTTYYQAAHLPGWLWLAFVVLAAAFAAALIGLLVGIPSLRLRGDYLAVMTMGFGEIARNFVINQDGGSTSIGKLDLGGSYGITHVPRLTELYQALLLLILAIAISRNLLKTAHGLSFLAVREDELAADATGVQTTRIKVVAFCVGAAIAGMAGALLAHYNRSVSPDDFKMDLSFMLVAMVVIGGTGSITGAAIAGTTIKFLEEALRELPDIPGMHFYSFVFALVIVLILYGKTKRSERASFMVQHESLLAIPGLIGLLALGYAAARLWSADVSVVIKAGVSVIVFATAASLLSKAGRSFGLLRFGQIVLLLLAALVLSVLLRLGMGAIPPVRDLFGPITYLASDLRWAIFSISLIVVMLTRPQGLMSHHEFSWDLFGGWLKKPMKEVAP